MDLRWLLKTAAYAAHAITCPACEGHPGSNCGGVTPVDLKVAAAVLGAAADHIRDETQRQLQMARASIMMAREAGGDR